MTIYIDKEFKCHLKNEEGFTAIETSYFDNKCDTLIEGYLFIPEGKTWTRADGVVFYGEMVTPWKNYDELDSAQRQYELELAEVARILLGGN